MVPAASRSAALPETGVPTAWEVACKAHYADSSEDAEGPTILEFVEIEKENGLQPTTMKAVRSTVGHEREAWRFAMQVEVGSLRDNETFQEATVAELRGVPVRKILPMKMVVGTKRDPIKKAEKKKARCVVCGNFQDKSPAEELYTANADITSVRAALAAGMRRKFSLRVIDVKTAFLNATLPDQLETVYVRPTQALIEFGLVAPG